MAGFLSRLRGERPQAFVSDHLDEAVARFFLGGGTHAGIAVGSDSAMRVSTYYACVNVLAQDIAKLPLILYRRLPNGGRERATKHPLYGLLHRKPNPFQTSFRFRQTAQAHAAMRGNAYALKTRVRGRVKELLPVSPDRMRVELGGDWRLRYKLDGKEIATEDVFHVRGLSLDGYSGVSVATYARETLGLALATEAHGARLFSTGALFRGILKHPGKLRDDTVAKRLRESFDEAFRGANAHKTALLEEGMAGEQTSMSAEDSQFLETREFQAYEVARWFRMPPHKVGLMKQATFSNIEHQALEYVQDTLLSWLINWEQECNAGLLTEEEQEEYFFEHLVDGLLRGDQPARYRAYKDAVLTGFMSRNEVRQKENLNPVDGLDDYLVPLNMASTDDAETDDE
jgi:HK97 family phage portal protein